jgi:hypothetical protein
MPYSSKPCNHPTPLTKKCRKDITIKIWDKNHKSCLKPKVEEVFGLLPDSTIYGLKCWIKEIKKTKYQLGHTNHSY